MKLGHDGVIVFPNFWRSTNT